MGYIYKDIDTAKKSIHPFHPIVKATIANMYNKIRE